MGTRLNDASELNPWTWVDETWNLRYSFNIANDFPSIDVWQSKLTSTVVVSGMPGLRAVPDLVTIHPILPPTVHIQPYHD